MDYDKIGLMVGLEIHAQLDTPKLFCSCPTELSDAGKCSIMRRLRPTMSELGEIDPAAKEEFTKGMVNNYLSDFDSSCLVYLDEEPPHDPNGDAVYILLQIAMLLQADICDQIQFMRKIVIDGSNVSGFQRTAMVALNGKAVSEYGNVLIPTICLEEDAARLVETKGKTKIWNVDRLGTPLVEIATDPSMHSPSQARDIALYLGQAMKATRGLKRGIGTIRQDVNISIRGGARVEIKGVQELNLIDDYVRNEATRQQALIGIRDELASRGYVYHDPKILDLSDIFAETQCKIIKGSVFGIALEKFEGLIGTEIQPKRRLGTEMSDYAKKYVRGIFHGDELPAYGITDAEVSKVQEALGVGCGDSFVIVAAPREVAYKALEAVMLRVRLACDGVPNETRRPLPDGTSQYMRPLPGRSRMYPETDVYPITVSCEMLEQVRSTLPELPSERTKRLCDTYGMSRDNAVKIIDADVEESFVYAISKSMGIGRFIRLVDILSMLSHEGVEVYDEGDLIRQVVDAGDSLPLESYEDVVRQASSGKKTVTGSMEGLGISDVGEDAVRAEVRKVLESEREMVLSRGKGAFKPVMGKVMAALRGKSDGKTISRILGEELDSILEKS